MEKDKIKYILEYHFSFKTIEEGIAWRHWSSLYKMESYTEELKATRTKLSIENGWMTNDE